MAQAVFEHLVKEKHMEAYFDRIEVRHAPAQRVEVTRQALLTCLSVLLCLSSPAVLALIT